MLSVPIFTDRNAQTYNITRGFNSLLTSGSADLYASTAKVFWIKQQKFCMAVWKGYTTANQRTLTLLSFLSHSFLSDTLNSSSHCCFSVCVFVTTSQASVSFHLFLLGFLFLFSLKLPTLMHRLTHIDFFFPSHVFRALHFLHLISHVANSLSVFCFLSSHLNFLSPSPFSFTQIGFPAPMICSHFPDCSILPLQHSSLSHPLTSSSSNKQLHYSAWE